VEETAVGKSRRDSTSVGAGSPAGTEAQLAEYNYEHFRPKHLLADVWRSAKGEGLQPGSEAPDFELESTDGDRVRLSSLRGRPVFLHFGSGT
jgi:cytochrome oxidase Cu insertion factor (SCO1/SenC/PrrC family)